MFAQRTATDGDELTVGSLLISGSTFRARVRPPNIESVGESCASLHAGIDAMMMRAPLLSSVPPKT